MLPPDNGKRHSATLASVALFGVPLDPTFGGFRVHSFWAQVESFIGASLLGYEMRLSTIARESEVARFWRSVPSARDPGANR